LSVPGSIWSTLPSCAGSKAAMTIKRVSDR